MPLFGRKAIQVPTAILTDADPQKIPGPDGKPVAHYPALGETVVVSANTAAMKAIEDDLVKVFYGVKTFEYDLALHEENRLAMLAALKENSPSDRC